MCGGEGGRGGGGGEPGNEARVVQQPVYMPVFGSHNYAPEAKEYVSAHIHMCMFCTDAQLLSRCLTEHPVEQQDSMSVNQTVMFVPRACSYCQLVAVASGGERLRTSEIVFQTYIKMKISSVSDHGGHLYHYKPILRYSLKLFKLV